MGRRVLLLNQTYEPLNIVSLRRAIKLLVLLKAELVYFDENQLIKSSSISIPRPVVIRLKRYIHLKYREPPLTKKNILLRDNYTCQYCGTRKPPLTIDHVIPKSRGGKDTWENLVTACVKCNAKKGDRTPEEAGMKLLSKPRKPTYFELIIMRSRIDDERWKEFLFLNY